MSSYPIGDRILRNIGLITASWSILETQMEFAILRAQEINLSEGLIVTSHLSFRAKYDLLMTFANSGDLASEEDTAQFKNLLGRILAAYGIRNAAAHHAWFGSPDPDVATRKSIKAKGKLQVIDETVHVNQLKEDVETIRTLGAELLEFMQNHGLAPEDSPENSP